MGVRSRLGHVRLFPFLRETWVDIHNLGRRPGILRGMMGYVVDLNVLMQSLFFLMQARRDASKSTTITYRFFKLALRAYAHNRDQEHSPTRVHYEIRTFANRSKAFKCEQK